MLALLLILTPARADEPLCPAGPADVEADLVAAETAYASLDEDGFFAALSRAEQRLGCLNSVASPGLSAHLHRLEGLAAFARRDPEAARLDFAAARRADGDYAFPTTLIPPGHELRKLYESYDLSQVTTVRVAAPATGTIYFDGVASTIRPTNVPTVAQVVAPSGTPLQSAWLAPGAPMVAYEPRGDKPDGRGRRIAGVGLTVASLGAIGWGTASLISANQGMDSYYYDLSREDAALYLDDQIRPLRTRGMIAVAGGGVGLLAGEAMVLLASGVW